MKFDPESMLFHGEVLGIRDIITFQGTNSDESIQAFQDSIDGYLEWFKERRPREALFWKKVYNSIPNRVF